MDFFQLAPLIAGISNLLLSLFVVSRDFRSLTNRIFFYWGISLTIWTFGAFLLFRVHDASNALTIARMLHFGVIFLPVLYTHLAILITGIPMRRILPWAYLVSVLLAISNFTPYFISGIRRIGIVYYAVAGPLYWILSSMVTILGATCVYLMIKKRRQLGLLQRRRVSAMIAALTILMILGAHDLLPVLGISQYPGTSITIYPIGTLAAFMFPVVAAYSVLQNQLLDIRFALGRLSATLVRLSFFFAIGFCLTFLCALLAPNKFTLGTIITCLIVLLLSGCISSVFFPKLLGHGAELLERRILGDRFEHQEQIQDFIETIPIYTNTNRLLDDLESLLVKTINASSHYITIIDPHTNELVVQRGQPITDALTNIDQVTPLLNFFRKSRHDSLNFSGLRPSGTNYQDTKPILPLVEKLQIELCFPLYSDREPFGFLLLGKKQTDAFYTAKDLELLVGLAKKLSLVFDQIRLKKRADLTEQLESLSIMSRGLAHDLNNLVTPIHTYLQFAGARPQPDGDIADLLRIAAKNLDTIRAYVREAVFFSNTLAPKIDLIHARELFDGLASLCKHQLDKRNIGLCLDLTDPFDFHGDPILIQRLLSNLIFNAMDASPSGSIVTLRAVRLHRVPGHPAWIRLQVIDRGSGISAENLGRVFAPYFTTKNLGDQTRGFGLGLTICQKIVHLHRGTISIHSTEGRGTTVQIDLPAEPAASPATQPS